MKFRRIAIAVGMVLVCVPAFSEGSFQWSNTEKWREYYSESDFNRPEIQSLIDQLKDSPSMRDRSKFFQNTALIESIARYGKDAIPYALRLKEDRAFYFQYTEGYFPSVLTVRRPYIQKAGLIIAAVRDPQALPLLNKLIKDQEIGRQALQAYEVIASSVNNVSSGVVASGSAAAALSSDTVRAIMHTSPSAIWMLYSKTPRLESDHMRMLANLPLGEAIKLIGDQIRDSRTGFHNTLSHHYYDVGLNRDFGHLNLNGYSEADVARINVLSDAIADLKSPGAFAVLYKQTYAVINVIGMYEHFGVFNGGIKPAGAEEKTKMLALANNLLVGYKRALVKISRSLKLEGLVISDSDWVWGPMVKSGEEPWAISFWVFSFSQQMNVTVEPGRSMPFVDIENVTWQDRPVQLDNGHEFPFEKRVVIHCPAQRNWQLDNFNVGVTGPSKKVVPQESLLSAFPPAYIKQE